MSVKPRERKGERTLLASALLSSPGPVVTGIATLLSGSTTQAADFIRRTAELAAILGSWAVFRRIGRIGPGGEVERLRLERLSRLGVGWAMAVSGTALLAVSLVNALSSPAGEAARNVIPGLVIASLGLITNAWFWARYRGLSRRQGDQVLGNQARLYRAKTFVDACVVAALSAVAIAPGHPATRWIDIAGSAIVACYLLATGARSLRRTSAQHPRAIDGLNLGR